MWRVLDHTADVQLEVETSDWTALLTGAVEAWGEWMSGGQDVSAAPLEKELQARGNEPVETWVNLWRALLRLWTVERALAVSAVAVPSARPELAGLRVRCASADALDLARCVDVKAVTWHEAHAAQRADGRWIGRIVLDL